MSEIFDHSEMSEEDVKHLYITTALESKWNPKKITMETEIWKAVKKRNDNLLRQYNLWHVREKFRRLRNINL